MRVLVAPDKFAGTLTAAQAADAITEGWRVTCPDDDVLSAPLSDGGPGFIDVMHAARGGDVIEVSVRGPLEEYVEAPLLMTGDTAYIESAAACGIALLPTDIDTGRPEAGVAERASTFGVGELIAHAVERGATKIVVGLGGSGTNDGGAGLLAALGARSEPDGLLTGGVANLAGLTDVDLSDARARLAGVTLTAAADVDNPLVGLRGATNVYGPQKGITSQEARVAVDAALAHFAELADPSVPRVTSLADKKGAGAAGGLGYGLMLLGGNYADGFSWVSDAVDLSDKASKADLIITGEGALDWQSLEAKVVSGVAEMGSRFLCPCIAIAGAVDVGNRELRANGIEAAYSLVDFVGEEKALTDPYSSLAASAARVAKTWGRR